MDRFESGHCRQYYNRIYDIYIPIWIDLKGPAAWAPRQAPHIYIPIWIDLKEVGNIAA